MPEPGPERQQRRRWWLAMLAGGPGWIIVGALKAQLQQLVAQDTVDSDTKLQNIATQFEAKMWHEASSFEDYLGKMRAKLAELKAR